MGQWDFTLLFHTFFNPYNIITSCILAGATVAIIYFLSRWHDGSKTTPEEKGNP